MWEKARNGVSAAQTVNQMAGVPETAKGFAILADNLKAAPVPLVEEMP